MKVKQAYQIQKALEIAECKNTDEHERMINVEWVNIKEIRKVINDFTIPGNGVELTIEQCQAFRKFFSELANIEFRPYLRCLKPGEHCVTCRFLKPCQELNPKLDLVLYAEQFHNPKKMDGK